MASPMTVHGRLSKMDTIQQKQNTKTAKRKESKWEILTNLDSATKYNIKPKKLEGILTKRRKWPMKGWHKRYKKSTNFLVKLKLSTIKKRKSRKPVAFSRIFQLYNFCNFYCLKSKFTNFFNEKLSYFFRQIKVMYSQIAPQKCCTFTNFWNWDIFPIFLVKSLNSWIFWQFFFQVFRTG